MSQNTQNSEAVSEDDSDSDVITDELIKQLELDGLIKVIHEVCDKKEKIIPECDKKEKIIPECDNKNSIIIKTPVIINEVFFGTAEYVCCDNDNQEALSSNSIIVTETDNETTEKIQTESLSDSIYCSRVEIETTEERQTESLSICDGVEIETTEEVQAELFSIFNEVEIETTEEVQTESFSSVVNEIESKETLYNEIEQQVEIEGLKNITNKRELAKLNREQGKPYLGFRRLNKKKTNKILHDTEKEGRKIGPRGCSKICTNKLCDSVTEEDRAALFNLFWSTMSWEVKKLFVCATVRTISVKQHTVNKSQSRRKNSFIYNLKINGNEYHVCKTMFLNTLGLKWSEVRNWLKNFNETSLPSSSQSSKDESKENSPDSGSENNPDAQHSLSEKQSPKEKRDFVKKFLTNIPKLPSHYCRKSSKKLYLQLEIRSKKQLYKIYEDECKENELIPLGETVFRRFCKNANVSVFKPRKDQCDTCYSYSKGHLSEEEHNLHLEKKDLAKLEKEKIKNEAITNDSCHVITFDLMAVQNVPLIRASSAYYKLKLSVYNFSIFNLKTKDAYCYWFDETATKLNSSVFASCLIEYIEGLLADSVKPVYLFSDGCTPQNRNAILSNALLHLAMTKNVVITQNILERGHTEMECDSIHRLIEEQYKYTDVYLPSQYLSHTLASRQKPFPYRGKIVDYSYFKNYSEDMIYESIRPGNKAGDPVVVDIRVLQYCPDGTINYKLNFNEEFKPLPNRRRISERINQTPPTMSMFPPLNKEPIKIPKDKYSDLQDLKKFIPNDSYAFYDGLPHETESLRESKKRKQEPSNVDVVPQVEKKKRQKKRN